MGPNCLYTGSNSEDPDEMQHKVEFYQDLLCHLQGLKIFYIPLTIHIQNESILSTDYWTGIACM